MELNTNIVGAVEYTNVKDDWVEYKRLFWKKNYWKRVWWKFKEEICQYIHKFSNHCINTFVLLLRKGIYPYEYMDDWEKFSETSLPEQ